MPCLASQVRLGLPATQWITIYNAHRPMKQRYHYNVANTRVDQHVEKGNDDGLYISSVACCQVQAADLLRLGCSSAGGLCLLVRRGTLRMRRWGCAAGRLWVRA